jgi:hypothetical protein
MSCSWTSLFGWSDISHNLQKYSTFDVILFGEYTAKTTHTKQKKIKFKLLKFKLNNLNSYMCFIWALQLCTKYFYIIRLLWK